MSSLVYCLVINVAVGLADSAGFGKLLHVVSFVSYRCDVNVIGMQLSCFSLQEITSRV